MKTDNTVQQPLTTVRHITTDFFRLNPLFSFYTLRMIFG